MMISKKILIMVVMIMTIWW